MKTKTPETIDAVMERVRVRRMLPSPDALRVIRQKAGLSQGDVAAVLGVERVTVSTWETGRHTPRGAVLDAYMALLLVLGQRTNGEEL
jgi:DNA-binding transcriptional regulator YiaG